MTESFWVVTAACVQGLHVAQGHYLHGSKVIREKPPSGAIPAVIESRIVNSGSTKHQSYSKQVFLLHLICRRKITDANLTAHTSKQTISFTILQGRLSLRRLQQLDA